MLLHVDDDAQLSRLVSERLRVQGFTVLSLDDPTRAVRTIQSERIGCALLDVDMPGKDGFELLREIKATDLGIQVVMFSGRIETETVTQAQRWGAEACFLKPLVDFTPLVDALNDCFRKIDRWRRALREVSARVRDHEPISVVQPATA
jgi:DNA-binding response OmpR family regulator